MKKLFTILFAISTIVTNAQILLDTIVPGYLSNTVLTREGAKQYYFNKTDLELNIFNTNGTLFKTISVPDKGSTLYICYVSDSLFNTDNKIEYILENEAAKDSLFVINEDGDFLLSCEGSVWDTPESDLIIDDVTKLLVKNNDTTWIYSLPGKYEPIISNEKTVTNITNQFQSLDFSDGMLTISDGNSVDISSVNTDEQQLSLNNDTLYLTNGGQVYIGDESVKILTISIEANGLSNAYPNPSNTIVNVEYKMPLTELEGKLELINNNGTVIETKNIYDNYGLVSFYLSSSYSGQYFIKLSTINGYSNTKKIVIIKE